MGTLALGGCFHPINAPFAMWTLLRKEMNSFFSSLMGYLVLGLFLLANGLFLWVFPGDLNLLDLGYADLAPYFDLAPMVFLFLVPAVTMRSFADEKRSGTLELLYTRPLSEWQISVAKYTAALLLVLLALLPTLSYFVSLYLMGMQVGNIDVGGTWGSFIGLFFLASVYVALGLLASALTENQIVAFLVGLSLAFVGYKGFEALANLGWWGGYAHWVQALGIEAHYMSMSRGVIDSRDVLYFLSLDAFVLWLATEAMRRANR